MAEMVRVNTRISSTLNEWLDKETKETGVPKSTLIMLAIESYWRDKEVVKNMNNMQMILQRLEEMEEEISRK